MPSTVWLTLVIPFIEAVSGAVSGLGAGVQAENVMAQHRLLNNVSFIVYGSNCELLQLTSLHLLHQVDIEFSGEADHILLTRVLITHHF